MDDDGATGEETPPAEAPGRVPAATVRGWVFAAVAELAVTPDEESA